MRLLKNLSFFILIFCALFLCAEVVAQCPMCKAAAESNMKAGGNAGAGLNHGILYLFFTPFLLATSFVLAWFWFNRKRKDEPMHVEDQFEDINQRELGY